MAHHYWAVRPRPIPLSSKAPIRIERAVAPQTAILFAFGDHHYWDYYFKDLGTRVRVIQTDKTRIALLLDPKGWESLPMPKKLKNRITRA